MADLTYFMLNFALEPIRGAYKAGKEALTTQYAVAVKKYDEFLAQVETGEVDAIWEDEETGQTFDHGEYILADQLIAESALQSHRQAFAIMIHHVWEKHVCYALKAPEYQCNKAYGELAKKGWPIDKPRLERLRMTANVVKHESAELYDHHPQMFVESELHVFESGLPPQKRKTIKTISKEGLRGNWLEALNLTDEDIADFIDTVRKSALPPKGLVRRWRQQAGEDATPLK
jgi:hypothetical protein